MKNERKKEKTLDSETAQISYSSKTLLLQPSGTTASCETFTSKLQLLLAPYTTKVISISLIVATEREVLTSLALTIGAESDPMPNKIPGSDMTGTHASHLQERHAASETWNWHNA